VVATNVRRVHALLVALLICACLAPTAYATQSVTLKASFTPEQLGEGTTISFGFEIAAPADRVPPPLTAIDISYPNDLGIALSGIGLATCTQARLEEAGPNGCPVEARMGYGTALAEISIGPEIIRESANVTLIRAPAENGHLAILFYANGEEPVSTQIVFPGLIVPAAQPFGGRINVNVPLIEGLPGAPDVAVVALRSTLGPQHLTYYETVRGRRVAYQPKGILLPDSCPPGGFPFAAELHFDDGSHARTHTTVRCP
jgi:hypothetical protein